MDPRYVVDCELQPQRKEKKQKTEFQVDALFIFIVNKRLIDKPTILTMKTSIFFTLAASARYDSQPCEIYEKKIFQ